MRAVETRRFPTKETAKQKEDVHEAFESNTLLDKLKASLKSHFQSIDHSFAVFAEGGILRKKNCKRLIKSQMPNLTPAQSKALRKQFPTHADLTQYRAFLSSDQFTQAKMVVKGNSQKRLAALPIEVPEVSVFFSKILFIFLCVMQ